MCQFKRSFRLGHSIQVYNIWGRNIWLRRHIEVFIPKSKKEAKNLIKKIFEKGGLPPVKYIFTLLERRKPHE